MCLYPTLIKNTKYTKTKKNGGIIPAVRDKRVLGVPIGCGRCMECMKKKKRDWQIRLLEDIKTNKNGIFVTLTFSNESIVKLKRKVQKKHGKGLEAYELDNQIATLAARLFNERWRKTNKKAIRHWLVTELGHNGTENIHMHGIVWTNKPIQEIKEKWSYGYVYPNSTYEVQENFVNEKTVNYITKYISKQDLKHKEYKPIVLTSSGIGKNYTNRLDAQKNKYKPLETNATYKTNTGHKMALPIYYRNKIYTDEERELLWIEMLNKNKRYICGEEIDISKGEEDYYKTLKHWRKKNTQLGYGTKTVNWSRKKYEEERRILLMQERAKQLEK